MDPYFIDSLWMTLIICTMPPLTCSMLCPGTCKCTAGNVTCNGSAITDLPQQLPIETFRLQLEDTHMTVINEQSLANRSLLLHFSLIRSHLHTIHPRAFHVAPQLISLKLSNSDLSTLPVRVLSPLTSLKQLQLDANQLETISPDMFEGLVELQELNLSHNKLTSLASDIFEGLTNLIFLHLGRNSIKTLPPTIFHSLTKLKSLIIYYNELEVLEAGTFDKLVNLVELKLQRNKIASLPPQVFWPLRNLQVLFLSFNQLQGVPEKTFYNMPKLSKFTIFGNPLLSLPDELMGHMPELREFYLFATNLTTVPGNLFANMSGLLNLNFHLNDKLRELPSDLFCCLPKLQKLSLRSNSLRYLHPQLFSKLTTLGILLLNDNKLESLPENIFHNLWGLLTIDLKNNHLKTLPGDIFMTNSVLKALMLTGNPWECTCPIRGIVRWIRHNEDVVLDRQDVICHSPFYQVLRTISSLRDEEFNCDVTTVRSYSPTWGGPHEPMPPFRIFSIRGERTPVPSTTTSSTTHGATQQAGLLTTIPPSESIVSDATTIPASLHTAAAGQPDEDNMSPFYGTLVLQKETVFVHHNFLRGWVYVWSLPSNATLFGFLVFCYILLVASGFLLILATMYGLYSLNKSMDKLKVECVMRGNALCYQA